MVGNRNTPRRLRFARELRSSQSVNFLVVFIATKRRGAQRPTHAHATMHEHMCDPVARTALSQPVCTLRLRSAKGDGLLIGRGGNDSASPRPRDRENHRFPSIYSFEGRECVVLSLTFFSPLRPRRLNDYLLPRSSIERFANRRIQGNLMGRNFFFFFTLLDKIFVHVCIFAIEYDNYSYLSKNENRIENLEKEIFFFQFLDYGKFKIYINICVNNDYEYI